MDKPRQEDYWDDMDPRGPSTREMDDYKNAMYAYNTHKAVREACEYMKKMPPEELNNIINNPMMTAKEAWNSASATNLNEATKELRVIEDNIKKAVKDGKFQTFVVGDLTEYTTERLEKLGYKITTQMHHNETDVIISWNVG